MTRSLSCATTKQLLISIALACFALAQFAAAKTTEPTETDRVDTQVSVSISTPAARRCAKLYEAFDSSFKKLANAEKLTHELVSESDDPLAQLARFQQALLQHWQTGKQASIAGQPVELLEFNFELPNTGEPSSDLQTVLLTQKVRLADEILFCDPRLHAHLLQQLEKHSLLAETPEIQCTGYAIFAYYNDHNAVDPEATKGHIVRLAKLAEQTSGTIADTILPYLSSRFEKDNSERQKFLDAAFAEAKKLNSQYFLGKLFEKQIPDKPRLRDIEKVRELHSSRVTAAESFGSRVEKLRCLKQLGKFEIRSGKDLVAAEKAFQSVRADPAFDHMDNTAKEAIWRGLYAVCYRNGDSSKALAYRNNLSSLETEKALAEGNQSRTAAIVAALVQSDYSNDLSQKLDQSQSDTNSLNDRLGQLKNLVSRYAWTLVATLGLLACGFLAYLARVKRLATKAELAKQQAIVAEEKKKVAELQVEVERLKRAQSLGTMAGSVAHDFNNLLFGVSGNAELIEMSLKNGTLDTEFGQTRITAILDASQRAQTLARQMLDFAGKRCLDLVNLDLNEFLRREQGIIESTSQSHLFEFDLSETPIMAAADETQLAQAILNFTTNAVEASASGSKITFRTFTDDVESLDNQPNLYGTKGRGGRFSVLEIVDQGVGIKPETVEQIFEPYFSTKNNGGRGLGLAVVYGMAESHEGFIRCYSTPGVGTKLQLLLPLTSAEAETPAINAGQPSPASPEDSIIQFKQKHSGKRILIVDDERSVNETCRQQLDQLSLKHESVYCGVDAIKRFSLADNKTGFDAILLDVVLPDVTGAQVLQQLNELGVKIPVIIVSGFSPERLDKYLNFPTVSTVLSKPFNFRELTKALGLALGWSSKIASNQVKRIDSSHELKPAIKNTGKPSASKF
jgi:signal transduction histidine kinase/FixJ family two-component response regulator